MKKKLYMSNLIFAKSLEIFVTFVKDFRPPETGCTFGSAPLFFLSYISRLMLSYDSLVIATLKLIPLAHDRAARERDVGPLRHAHDGGRRSAFRRLQHLAAHDHLFCRDALLHAALPGEVRSDSADLRSVPVSVADGTARNPGPDGDDDRRRTGRTAHRTRPALGHPALRRRDVSHQFPDPGDAAL